MTEKSLFAGFGGQGIVSLGQIWAYCGMKEGKNVTFFPAYGAEKRGGIARSSVIVSDTEIASPLVTTADSALAMNQDSLGLCVESLREGGLLVINSNLVKIDGLPRNIRVVAVAADEIARDIGNPHVANMVALGALAKLTGALALTEIEAILQSFFPPEKHKFIPLNLAAIQRGSQEAVR